MNDLVQIQTFSGSCVIDGQCDGTLQLICNGSMCICSGATPYGTWFWNGTQCGIYNYFQTVNFFQRLIFLVLCPLGWLNYQIYCYYPSSAPATWANSRIYCQKFGADLLVIKTQAEYNFIQPYAATIIGPYGHANIGYYTSNTTSRKLNN